MAEVETNVPALQLKLVEMLIKLGPMMKKLQNPLSVFAYHVLPFYYAFLEGSGFFRYVLYPMVFVAPWAMMAFQQNEYSLEIIHVCSPFVGFVFLLYCLRFLRQLFKRKPQGENLFQFCKFVALTATAAVVPVVPFSYQNGIAIQFSWPFLEPKMAFGLRFYASDVGFFDRLVGGVAIPVLGHSWAACLLCTVLALFKFLGGFCSENTQ